MKNLLWLAGWLVILIGVVVGAVAFGLLAGAVAVLGYLAVVLIISGGALLALTGSQNEPSE